MSERDTAPSSRTSLRICFADGDRPFLFWLSTRAAGKQRYKILSKRARSGDFEILVVEEQARSRRVLAHKRLARDLPSGWLPQWVDRLARDLEVSFRCYDLRGIETPAEWNQIARALGWIHSATVDGS